MCERTLLRLPVVDAQGRLVGIVSRADLVRAVAGGPPERELAFPHPERADGATPVGAIMAREVPAVRQDATIREVVDAVVSTRLNRAVVVDGEDRVLGIVDDAELVQRLTPGSHPGFLTDLLRGIPFARGDPERERARRLARGTRADEVMLTDIVVPREDAPIREVLAGVVEKRRKIAPVADREGRLAGVVDRVDLLAVLVGA
jgi:CBS domain-containing protein